MFKILKKLLIISSLSIVSIGTVTFINNQDIEELEQPSYIESIKLNSSRFSQVDDLSVVDPKHYLEIEDSDDLIAENSNLKLYYDRDIVSFKIENKANGYVFATHIDDAKAGTYTGLLSTGIGVEYIQVTRNLSIAENVGITDIVFNQKIEKINNGVKIAFKLVRSGFLDIQISFDLQVTLESDGIRAEVPYESIVEGNPESALLSSIIIFPALGATKSDDIPGYMMIPDGAGALVRYEDNEGRYRAPYRANFYGLNYGLVDSFTTISDYPLSMPIFGMVHGVNQNGLLGIIESGDYSSRLFMFTNGVLNIDYNFVFPKFDFKKTFLQKFSANDIAGSTRYVETSKEDINIAYKVLTDNQANYVGMANKYQEYLVNDSTFNTLQTKENIPLQLTYLMSDSKNSLFGTTAIKMSTADDITSMHEYFINQNIDNFEVSLMGWNEGGYSGHLPSPVDFENSLGSNAKFENLITYLQESSKVSLINNYVIAGEDASGIQDRRDIAKGVDRFRLTTECPSCVYQTRQMLYPNTSYNLAKKHLEDYSSLGVEAYFEKLGSISFSYYDSDFYTQADTINKYLEIMQMYDDIANYEYPNAYAYKYTNSFKKAPMFHSQLNYFDDLVPVLQIVLMGKLPMFSNYLNFNSYGTEFLLQLIDFNVYPAYVLTMNEASSLKNTDIENIYTSEFDLWKTTVIDEYNYINNALKHVIGESLVSRETLFPGVVKNTYSNGVIIYINYSSSLKTIDEIPVEANSYALGGE